MKRDQTRQTHHLCCGPTTTTLKLKVGLGFLSASKPFISSAPKNPLSPTHLPHQRSSPCGGGWDSPSGSKFTLETCMYTWTRTIWIRHEMGTCPTRIHVRFKLSRSGTCPTWIRVEFESDTRSVLVQPCPWLLPNRQLCLLPIRKKNVKITFQVDPSGNIEITHVVYNM